MSREGAEKEGRVLIVDPSSKDRNEAQKALRKYFPQLDIQSSSSIPMGDIESGKAQFDILVLDSAISTQSEMIEMLYRLKTLNDDPFVVATTKDGSAKEINELYKHGAHRCIEKDPNWQRELGTAVDYLYRWRKAKAENLSLRAKLTEANMLLQEKNKRLDEFSASLAHDIRGPLGGVSMRLDYLISECGGELNEKFRTLLERAHDATTRLTELVQAMYEYAKLGAKAAKMGEISLSELLQQTLEDMPFDPALDIQVELEDLPVVWGNPQLLRQAFINILNNAVKYNDKSTKRISIKFDGIQDKVLAPFCSFQISDNGQGIDPRDLKDVFSMFVRGNNAEEQASGVGVGLAIVRRIVELHYGEISVSSELGVGTSFHITLPMQSVTALD